MEHSKVAAKEFGYDAIAQRRAGKNEIEDLNVRALFCDSFFPPKFPV